MHLKVLTAVACVVLVGCDYTVPLVTTPQEERDGAVIGLWQRSAADGKMESLLVLPLGAKEYLVAFPAGSKDALYARGCLWRGPALTLVQLDWFGTGRGSLPDDPRTFQYASYAIEGDSLRVRLLNPEVVPKDIASSNALVKAISDNRDHTNFFRAAMVFQKTRE